MDTTLWQTNLLHRKEHFSMNRDFKVQQNAEIDTFFATINDYSCKTYSLRVVNIQLIAKLVYLIISSFLNETYE